MPPDPLTTIANLAYWLLMHEIARDLFPDVPFHTMSGPQIAALNSRMNFLRSLDPIGFLATPPTAGSAPGTGPAGSGAAAGGPAPAGSGTTPQAPGALGNQDRYPGQYL